MTSFAFSIPTRIQFGPGVSRQAGAEAKLLASNALGSKHCTLVVIDPAIQSATWLNEILRSLEENGLQVSLFSDVEPNPKDVKVYAAAAQLQRDAACVVVAIGGGSTIDTAKGAALIASYGGKVSDYAGWQKVPGPVIPLIAIPTTAGSGSEATCWAVITDTVFHAKLAIGDRNLAAAVALVDPLVTLSLPSGITAATGMDALTHSIEAYICVLASPVNDLFALESIRLVAANLLKAVAQGQDLAAREAMMLASTLGGVAINNADVAGVHCLSEGMGSLYDAPHGLLNAILLPYFMAFWQGSCQERFAHIAEAFGAPPRPEEAVKQVVELNSRLNFPALPALGVKREHLPALAALAEANVSNSSNPVPMIKADYLEILERALSGQAPGIE